MKVFVDSSALLAILDADDPHHDSALEIFESSLVATETITHNYVHVEAEQLVRRRLGSAASMRLLHELLPALRTIWVDEETHAEAVRGLASKGRSASLVDEVSFVVMRNEGTDVALAFDADFDHAGYRLPESEARHTLSETRAPYGTSGAAADLVSVSELAARSGRSVNTIQSWRRRHADFPSPNVELAAGPIWLWRDVSAWIDRRSQRAPGAAGR